MFLDRTIVDGCHDTDEQGIQSYIPYKALVHSKQHPPYTNATDGTAATRLRFLKECKEHTIALPSSGPNNMQLLHAEGLTVERGSLHSSWSGY